ncbi:MAG: Kdo hydroxylase family protein, partial [Candidatus Acidiferrales bacterium]
MANQPFIFVEDYKLPGGWVGSEQHEARARAYCEMAERGQILFFRELPFDLPLEDQKFLREQEWTELRMHKNVSYRPSEDILRGVSGNAATVER